VMPRDYKRVLDEQAELARNTDDAPVEV
jgi:hypothetical protein